MTSCPYHHHHHHNHRDTHAHAPRKDTMADPMAPARLVKRLPASKQTNFTKAYARGIELVGEALAEARRSPHAHAGRHGSAHPDSVHDEHNVRAPPSPTSCHRTPVLLISCVDLPRLLGHGRPRLALPTQRDSVHPLHPPHPPPPPHIDC